MIAQPLPPDASPFDAVRAARELAHYPDGRKLSAQEKALLYTLSTYWPNVHPSVPALAAATGLSKTRVHEWMGELETGGLVVTRQRGNGLTAERELRLVPTREDS